MNDATITLAYGRNPLTMRVPKRLVKILEPNQVPGVPDLEGELRRALANPVGCTRLKDMVVPSTRVALVISDRTRTIPRREMILSVLEELAAVPDKNITIVVACGNHSPSTMESLNLGKEIPSRFRVVVHSAGTAADGDMVLLGRTKAGTDVRINKAAAEADLRVLIGQIKPHYFTGYSGGAKSILPGVSSLMTIAFNHAMKSKEGARLGNVEGNPVRADMEEAAAMAGRNFILNIVTNVRREVVRAVAGDVVAAHREGTVWARKVSEVPSPRADVVVISDSLPLTMDLYQASKLVAAAAPLVKPHGIVVLAAECNEGVGPLHIVNEMIYKMGLCQALPPGHRVLLVSGLPKETVAETYCEYTHGLPEAMEEAQCHVGPSGGTLVIPKGGLLVPIPHP